MLYMWFVLQFVYTLHAVTYLKGIHVKLVKLE